MTEERLVASPAIRAEHLASHLSLAGLTPRIAHHDDYSCVDATVPKAITAESWQELLAVLETADCFGLVDSSENGLTVWASVTGDAADTAVAARGHSHQK